MVFYFKSQNIELQSVVKENFQTKNLTESEIKVLTLSTQWLKNNNTFHFQTSGSTGRPKNISHDRQILEYSAKSTIEYLNLKNNGIALLCISPNFIGGAMVVFRALINDMDLQFLEPAREIEITRDYELASMVPMQLEWLVLNKPQVLSRIRNILIGGAPLDITTEKQFLDLKVTSNVYATYGMTETASHVALRRLGSLQYQGIGDVKFEVDRENCLRIKGTVTHGKWLQTNDIVELRGRKSFEWIGRKDFVINSGGIKISPEKIETLLKDQIKQNFVVSSVPDKSLGEKLVLVIEGKDQELLIDYKRLPKYHQPKQIIHIDSIPLQNEKIDRKAIQSILMQMESE
jgi:O-succinylbenzoic acid--CoA ligase